MGAVYFCADLHIEHNNIGHYRNFDSNDLHLAHVKKRWHARVRKKDTVFILGDVAFNKEGWKEFATWVGNKVVILGNHCTERTSAREILSHPSIAVHGLLKYKEFWLSHAPMHPLELRGKRNIHGHTHSFTIPDSRYLGVSLEQLDYTLVSLDEVRAEFKRRDNLMYVYKKFGAAAALATGLRQIRKKT